MHEFILRRFGRGAHTFLSYYALFTTIVSWLGLVLYTGGLLFSVNDPDDLKEAVLDIQQEMRFQYVIGYHPTRRLWDGSFRRIKLETAQDGLIVRTRAGYYAYP